MTFLQQRPERPLLVLEAEMDCLGEHCPNYTGAPCEALVRLTRIDKDTVSGKPPAQELTALHYLEYTKLCLGGQTERTLGFIAVMDDSVSAIDAFTRLDHHMTIFSPEFILASGGVLSAAAERLLT